MPRLASRSFLTSTLFSLQSEGAAGAPAHIQLGVSSRGGKAVGREGCLAAPALSLGALLEVLWDASELVPLLPSEAHVHS